MTTLPALTVWQPWATLIAIGAKPYEFRKWRAPKAHRGRRIAIHAAARPVRARELAGLIESLCGPRAWETCLDAKLALPLLDAAWEATRGRPSGAELAMLPLSAVVATAMLGEPRRGEAVAAEFGGPAFEGTLNDSDRDEHCQWGWPLADVERLEPPAPARGAQGFWTWTDGRLA